MIASADRGGSSVNQAPTAGTVTSCAIPGSQPRYRMYLVHPSTEKGPTGLQRSDVDWDVS
jgi:hypothetical protein